MSEIQFKRGEFITFTATTKFHLGEKQKDIWDGDEIEFDGQTVKYQGDVFSAPSIRGAVKAGWLALSGDNVSKYIPKPANVIIHKAQSTGRDRGDPIQIGHTQDEEQEVGLVESHRERVKTASDQNMAPRPRAVKAAQETPEEVVPGGDEADLASLSEDELIDLGMQGDGPEPDATTSEARPRPRSPAEAEEYNRAILAKALAVDVPKPKDPAQAYGGTRYNAVSDEPSKPGGKKFAYKAAADDQGGQVVGRIKTSASGVAVGAEGVRLPPQATDVSKVTPQSIEASQKPIGGGKRPQLPDPTTLQIPSRPARTLTAAKPKALITDAAPAPQKPKRKVAGAGGGATPTGAITMPEKSSDEEGFKHKIPKGTATQVTEGEGMTTKSNGTTGDVKETRTGDDLTDLLPDALVAGVKPPGSIVGQDSEGFSWDKGLHWKTRVSLAVKNYGNQPAVIKQILAAETPTVAKQIRMQLKGKSV